MRFQAFITALLSFGAGVSFVYSHCNTTLQKRQEWRTLSDPQKSSYISAVKCLQSNEPKTDIYSEVKSRFDDFQAVHISLADGVHLVGHFLPWHRYLLKLYENALEDECGYEGAQPYWDWTLDTNADKTSLADSPIFDPTTGFGGNGADIPGYNGFFNNLTNIADWNSSTLTGGGCLVDGPFASYNLSLGPGTEITNHCISRAWNWGLKRFVEEKQVKNTTDLPTFEEFRIELEGTTVTPHLKIHDGGHFLVGGEMGDRYSSPGDPLFYLHHANLDRIWWTWQKLDSPKRLFEVSGRSTPDPPYVNITLDFPLQMQDLAPTVPIRDVMDLAGETLCYDYV